MNKGWLLDANVILRFLVQDDPKHSPAATALFEQAERRDIVLHLDPLVVAETVYVLIGRYNRSRSEVANALIALIQIAGIEATDRPVMVDALQRFANVNVDFADAWLAARAAHSKRPVASFDHDLDKFTDIKRIEPGK